jgi:hypothetical protein
VKMPAKLHDNVAGRGRKVGTPLGTTICCGLRAPRPIATYFSPPHLLRSLQYLGQSAAVPPPTGGNVVTAAGLDLTPLQAIIWGMRISSAVEQIF